MSILSSFFSDDACLLFLSFFAGRGNFHRGLRGQGEEWQLGDGGHGGGHLHHLQRGGVREPLRHPHHQYAPGRHLGHARHQDAPHGGQRSRGAAAHDVRVGSREFDRMEVDVNSGAYVRT